LAPSCEFSAKFLFFSCLSNRVDAELYLSSVNRLFMWFSLRPRWYLYQCALSLCSLCYGWWLVLICYESKILLAGWWLLDGAGLV